MFEERVVVCSGHGRETQGRAYDYDGLGAAVAVARTSQGCGPETQAAASQPVRYGSSRSKHVLAQPPPSPSLTRATRTTTIHPIAILVKNFPGCPNQTHPNGSPALPGPEITAIGQSKIRGQTLRRFSRSHQPVATHVIPASPHCPAAPSSPQRPTVGPPRQTFWVQSHLHNPSRLPDTAA